MPHFSHRQKKIIKQNGQEELFTPEKLCNSIIAVGATYDLAQEVCNIVENQIESGTSTDKIFVSTRKYLQNYNPRIAGLYALERGLSALGPSGFLFEQYVAGIFLEMGYRVKTNIYAQGEGIHHEIDVWSEKGNFVLVVEAKYRNDYRTKTPVDQVMYADARIQDIKRRAKKDGDTREYYMWMVTNTRFSESALSYVRFRELQLMGWDYPKYINLKKIVSEKKLYPVTVLPSITKKALRAFSEQGMVLVKSLSKYTVDMLKDQYNFSHTLAVKLEKEIKELLN